LTTADLDTPVWSLFEAVWKRQPDKLAVDDGTTSPFTYTQLREAALAVAGAISCAVAERELVAIVLRHTTCHPLGVLACLASGHPCLVLDAAHPAARNAQVIVEARPAAVLLDRGVDDLPVPCARIRLADAITAKPAAPAPARPDDPAFVISTSGSTGTPKCIVLSQRNLLHQVMQDSATCRLRPADRFLPLGSPAAVSPLRGLLTALLSGGTLFLRDLHDGFSPVFTTMRERGITVSRIGPSLLRAMVALPGAATAFRSMRIIRVGGEILSGEDVMRMRGVLPATCTLVFAYGSTEIPPIIERVIPAHGPVEKGVLHIGTPLPGSRLSLVDERGDEVQPGEAGELLVRGPHLALGYWVDGTCVPGDITPDPAALGERCFRSGDILRRRADGQWEFVRRVDHQVKIRGNRAEPGEAETVLRGLPGVADAVVLTSDNGDGPSLIAFVVPSGTADGEFVDQLRAALAGRLPDHARPSTIRVIAAIPRLGTFKPDFAALRSLLQDDGAGEIVRRGLFARRRH
jgi:acyl-coenzyme A synthetase/AMP-(fatty) acid ligase